MLCYAIDVGISLTNLPSLKKKLRQFEEAGAKAPLILEGDQDTLLNVNCLTRYVYYVIFKHTA